VWSWALGVSDPNNRRASRSARKRVTSAPRRIVRGDNVTQLGADLYRRAEIPNAIIPNPDPYAVKMYSYYPLPNRTPEDVFNTNNFESTTTQTIRRHSSNNRVDFKLNNHAIYGSGGISYAQVVTPRPFGAAPFNDAAATRGDKNPYIQVGDAIVLGPTLLLNVRYGLARVKTENLNGNKEGFTDYYRSCPSSSSKNDPSLV
jgi:trimeric autotransporter adhesin